MYSYACLRVETTNRLTVRIVPFVYMAANNMQHTHYWHIMKMYCDIAPCLFQSVFDEWFAADSPDRLSRL